MTFNELKRCWLATVLAALLAACGGSGEGDSNNPPGGGNPNPPPPPTIQTVVVSPGSASVEAGKTVGFTAVARDGGGNVVANTTFTWSTSDAAVATIANDGIATGVKAGNVSVRASAAGVTSNAATLAVTVPPPVAGASSDELIAAALAAGEIDAQTALAYRVFANYRDARLPAKYRGNDTNTGETSAKAELDAAFDTLSPALQDQLAPFLMRPSSVGSWLDKNPPPNARIARTSAAGLVRPQARLRCLGIMSNWVAVDPPTAGVRVWYDRDEVGHDQIAAYVAARIEAKAWPTLINTLGFLAPLDDSTLVGCDGGNAKLDIYIVNQSGRGFTYPESSPSYDRNRWSTYIEINAALGPSVMEHAIAHELAHAIHRAYPTAASKDSYGWFLDGFANWAALQVEPRNLSIAEQASCVFRSSWLPLDDRAGGYCQPSGNPPVNRDYGAFLFLEYVSKTSGPAAVKSILQQTASASSAFDAMEAVFGSSFNDVWKGYAQTLWNQDAIRTRAASFFNWQGFENVPELARDLPAKVNASLGGAPDAETALEKKVNNMSVKFYHFEFSDVNTRTLMFHNTWNVNKRNNQKVSVQALFKAEGGVWKEEDWTDYEWIGFCRDFKEQRLEQLVVIVASAEHRLSNSTPVVEAAEVPKLMRNNIGCWGWSGTLTRTYSSQTWSSGVTQTRVDGRWDYSPTGFPPQYTNLATNRLRVPLAAPLFTSANVSFNDTHAANGCSYSTDVQISDSSVVVGGSSASTIVLNNFLDSLPDDLRTSQIQLTGTAERAYVSNGVINRLVTGSVSGEQPRCGTSYTSAIGVWWLTKAVPETPPQVAADGHLRGSYVANRAGDNYSETFEWDLAPLRQP
jgi:hypothetical protein